MFAQSGHRLIKALYIRQVFPCGPANRAPIESSTELTVNVVVEHLPAVAEWPRNSNQKRHRHVCSDCGAVFMEKLQLIEHVKSEHGRNRFSCPCCECTFVSKGGLKAHIQYIHQKVARYRCETCGKGYANRTHFVDHLTTHTGVKRNVCSVCQASFAYKHGLKAHVLRFHPNVDV